MENNFVKTYFNVGVISKSLSTVERIYIYMLALPLVITFMSISVLMQFVVLVKLCRIDN